MAKQLQKEKALMMRKKGESIGNIASALKVSKSTVSYWCRDIILSSKQIDVIYSRARNMSLNAILKKAEEKRKERIILTKELTEKGEKEVGRLSKRDLFILGLGLYWGEGYKSGNEELALTNSDPTMIKLFINWLEKIYGVSKAQLICRISINQIHIQRESELVSYWVKVTGIPKKQFTKTSFIQAKTIKVYKNNEIYFGVLRVKARNGVNLRRKILGSIRKLQS